MNNKGFQEYTGLTEKEALSLLQKNGKNCLKEDPPKSTFKIFLEQILNWTNLILAIAIIICFILKDFGEAIIILVIIIANGIIGVVQEGKAQKALDALKQMSVLKCTVIRDKLKKEIENYKNSNINHNQLIKCKSQQDILSQPILRFKNRTDLERICDTIEPYLPPNEQESVKEIRARHVHSIDFPRGILYKGSVTNLKNFKKWIKKDIKEKKRTKDLRK